MTQRVRVVVQKEPSGCWGALGVVLLIGLAIEYWYISLGVLVLLFVIGAVARFKREQQRKLADANARRRPGPRDPWLNEVAVALADLQLTEVARNTGAQIAGVPIDGDIGLDTDRVSMFVTLFASDELARRAQLALRAKPEVRTAESNGRSAIKAQGRVLYTANGRGVVVDEFQFDEVISVVDKLSLPPPLLRTPATAAGPVPRVGGPSDAPASVTEPDALEQLRKLGELRATGVLSEAEFNAKKAELLRRV